MSPPNKRDKDILRFCFINIGRERKMIFRPSVIFASTHALKDRVAARKKKGWRRKMARRDEGVHSRPETAVANWSD